MNDKERTALRAYAVAAAAFEDAQTRARDAQLALDEAEEAAQDAGAPEGLPVTVTLPDGLTVTIDTVNESYNDHLEYTIGTAL